MILEINPAKDVTITPAIPEETVSATEVTVITISDNTIDAVVAAIVVNGYNKVLTLWNASTIPTYEQIGDWTQVQANARIIELI